MQAAGQRERGGIHRVKRRPILKRMDPADEVGGLRGPAPEDRPRDGDLTGVRVLVVDDSDESRALVEGYLAPSGAALELAADVPAALAMFQAGTFDVVLMGLHLPGTDGFAATREIRRLESESGARPTAVVALSADASPATVRNALDGGFTEHLAKPIRRAALTALLQRYRGWARARSASQSSATVARLLPRFLQNRERDMVAIREALAGEDFETIATLGHNMRGNGVSYGFLEVSAIGWRLESAAHVRDARQIEEDLPRLEACIARIRTAEGAVDDEGQGTPGRLTAARPASTG
jgi:CheY-like chemotaxis protein